MTETTSLSDIRPGDKVICCCSMPPALGHVKIVDRVTKTQIIIEPRRFRISDGRELGSSDLLCYWQIIPATPEKIADLERQQQLKQDQDVVYRLAKQISSTVRNSPNAAAAIPHLEAALISLKQENNND